MGLFCASTVAQDGTDRFVQPSTAIRRFETWRGAERLPKVDLAAAPAGEGRGDVFEQIPELVRVRGGLAYQMEFSDNIFYVRGGEIPGRHDRPSDIFYIISPNVHLEVPALIAPIIVDYNVDITRAGSFSEFNTEEHYLSGIMDLKLGHGFGVRLRDALSRQSAPPSWPARRTRYAYFQDHTGVYDPGEQTSWMLNNFWSNTAEFVGYYKSPYRLRVEGRFVHDLARFDAYRNWDSDYDMDTAGGELSYKIMPAVSFLSEYYHDWMTNAGLSPDYEHDKVGGGLEWDISAKLNSRFLMGYEWYHIKSASNAQGLYFHTEMIYDYSSKLRFGFYGDRTISQTTALARNLLDGGTFVTTTLSLNTLYRVTPKVNATGEVFYIMDDYPYVGDRLGPRREDDLWGLEVGLEWVPRAWMRLGAKYRYQKNASSIMDDCYEENRFFLNAVIGF